MKKKFIITKLVKAKNITNKTIQDLNNLECLIIDDFNENIDEKLLYSILNQSKQLENFILINSIHSIKND